MKGQAFGAPGVQLKPANIAFGIPLEDKFQTFVVNHNVFWPTGRSANCCEVCKKPSPF